jgi:hypothetical protein
MENCDLNSPPHSLEGFFPIISSRGFMHYTCNSPEEELLKEWGILSFGRYFGREDKEVLFIPNSTYSEMGFKQTDDNNELVLNMERLLVLIERGAHESN